jgi:hypothetical protein
MLRANRSLRYGRTRRASYRSASRGGQVLLTAFISKELAEAGPFRMDLTRMPQKWRICCSAF